MSDMLSHELLRRLFIYEPETGKLYWAKRTPDVFTDGLVGKNAKCSRWNTRWAGKEAFANGSVGYRNGHVLGVPLLAHRVIWVIVNGEWPDQIDHIDGDRSNNKVENLRSVTPAENAKNRCLHPHNKSGYSGVCWISPRGVWEASIVSQGSRHFLGYFESKADAIQARQRAERKLGFHKNNGRS